jgi:hypothetical protein
MKTRTRNFSAWALLVGAGWCLHFAKCRADPLDTWYWRNPLPTGNLFDGSLQAVAFGNDSFVAVGGMPITSRDGVNWEVQDAGAPFDLKSIIYGIQQKVHHDASVGSDLWDA